MKKGFSWISLKKIGTKTNCMVWALSVGWMGDQEEIKKVTNFSNASAKDILLLVNISLLGLKDNFFLDK